MEGGVHRRSTGRDSGGGAQAGGEAAVRDKSKVVGVD